MSVRIYLIARPKFDSDAFGSFLLDQRTTWARTDGAHEPEEIVEVSGRVCYMSFGDNQSPRTNQEYIRNLVRMGHESVLEHVCWTFLITGVSRAFSHQLVRHRVGFAFSQLSQQYHTEEDATFVEPPGLRACPAACAAWEQSVRAAKEAYQRIADSLRKLEERPDLNWQKKELRRAIHSIARSVLPNATETKIMVTANARALRHFLTVRGSVVGDLEMRTVAAELLKLLKVEASNLFADFQLSIEPDGFPIVVRQE
jgi:thymidylate synthase (FAD)